MPLLFFSASNAGFLIQAKINDSQSRVIVFVGQNIHALVIFGEQWTSLADAVDQQSLLAFSNHYMCTSSVRSEKVQYSRTTQNSCEWPLHWFITVEPPRTHVNDPFTGSLQSNHPELMFGVVQLHQTSSNLVSFITPSFHLLVEGNCHSRCERTWMIINLVSVVFMKLIRLHPLRFFHVSV